MGLVHWYGRIFGGEKLAREESNPEGEFWP